ncbi:hypothetical protein HDU81_004748 [Chytriomyces hyalinus]|nr:hypothetical protein HDU81_004748 [Chytriomyces hyalinus]
MRNSGITVVSLSTALAASFIVLGAMAVTASAAPSSQLDHSSYTALFKLDGTLHTLSKLTDAYLLVMQVSAVLSVLILAQAHMQHVRYNDKRVFQPRARDSLTVMLAASAAVVFASVLAVSLVRLTATSSVNLSGLGIMMTMAKAGKAVLQVAAVINALVLLLL